ALQERFNVSDVLADVRAELEEIVADERAGIERRLDEAASPPPVDDSAASEAADQALRKMLRDAAARRLDQLESLPRDVGKRIKSLEEDDFIAAAGRERFQALTDRLRRQTLDRFVDGLSQAIQGTTPEELQANRE